MIELNDDEDELPHYSESESWDRQGQGLAKEKWNGGPQYDDNSKGNNDSWHSSGEYERNAVKGEDLNCGPSYDNTGRRNDAV